MIGVDDDAIPHSRDPIGPDRVSARQDADALPCVDRASQQGSRPESIQGGPAQHLPLALGHHPGIERGMDFPSHEQFQQQIRKALPHKLHGLPFRVDMAPLDPRPDPKDTRGIPLLVYDPGTRGLSTEPLEELLDLLPTRLVQFRIYALDHDQDAALSRAAATVLNKTSSSMETNF